MEEINNNIPRPEGILRRCFIPHYSRAESVICFARAIIEGMPADTRLTDATVLLNRAQDRVADYIDGVASPEVIPDPRVEVYEQELNLIRNSIPGEFVLDPPDGGDVKTVEAIRRMVEEIKSLRQTNPHIRATMEELDKARLKFPQWPTDPLHALGVLNEELGELTKEVVQLTYEKHKASEGRVRKEAYQMAAMAIRFIVSLNDYIYSPSMQHSQLGGCPKCGYRHPPDGVCI